MSDMITERDEHFASMIAGFFHDMLRAAGISMTTPQKFHERTREIGRKFAYSIEFRAEKKAVEVIRILQKAVSKAFDGVENEQKALRERVEALEAKLEALTSGTNRGEDSRVLSPNDTIQS